MQRIINTLLITLLLSSAAVAQYCAPTSAGGTGTFMNSVSFSNMTNNSIATNPTASPYYMSYTNTATVFLGQSYNLSLTMDAAGTYSAAIASVWIDYNQNLVFDASEWQQIGTAIPSGQVTTVSVTIPITATPGNTKMRIRTRGNGNINGAIDACTVFGSGETEDYNITIVPPTPCAGQPVGGTTTTSNATVCPANTFSLSMSGVTLASGLTYQWQSSLNGTTFTNITGATSPSYNTTQSVNTYYQCVIICTASGLTATSTPVFVTTSSFIDCYCASNATSVADEEILNVSVSTLNNTSTCSTTGGAGSIQSQYSNYTATVPAPILAASVTYPLSVQIGTCGGNFSNATKVFIDFNQNGSFTDPGENVYTSAAAVSGPHFETGNFTVPPTATLGLTRMRVVNVETTLLTSINPCGTYTWGETEDYIVNIAPMPTCPQPNSFSVLTATTSSATLQWNSAGSETQWQIEYGPQGFVPGTGTLLVVNSNPYTLNGLTTNSFYQAYIQAICSATDTSYWAGVASWNTYGQAQYLEYDSECPTSGFVNIAATGTACNTTDDSEIGVALPFPLLYQATLINDITIGNNGGILLGTQTGAVGYTMTPTGLFPYVQDLNTPYGGVYYQTVGTAPNRKFIVMWSNLAHYFSTLGTDGVTFELIIEETTNEVYFVYDDVMHDNAAYNYGLDAEIGATGAQTVQVSMNNASYLQNNSCVHFYYTDCPKPSALTYAYVSTTEASITWTGGIAGETNWTIIYGPAGFNPASGGTTITTTATNAIIPNLTQLTTYDIYIYSDCSPTIQSLPLASTFTTLPYCSNPSAMFNSSATDSLFVSWAWTASSPAYPSTGFNVVYGMSGYDPYTQGTEVVLDNNLNDTITNPALLGGGVYEVYVQAVCANDTSAYIGPFSVTMPLTNDDVCGAEMLAADGTVYTFNNTGATVTLAELVIAPPATGPQTTTGWINSALDNTTWFRFIAPASGDVRINNTYTNYAGQAAVFDATNCSDFNNFTLVAANDNAIGGTSVAPNFTICGLTPGNMYYLLHDGNSATAGNYSISIIPIDFQVGSVVGVIDVCTGDTADLFTAITGYDAGGIWTAQIPSAGIGLNGSIFNSEGLAYQVFNFEYTLQDGCASDSIIAQVNVSRPSSAGEDGTITVCRNEPVDLLAGLNGNIDLGGMWYNPSNVLMPNSEITAPNIPGQYNYDYISGNGICPNDTANVLLNVDANCNFNALEETLFSAITLYPNPSNGVVFISNEGNTGVFDIEVKDLNGRTIMNKRNGVKPSSVSEINLTDKVTGIYFITLRNEDIERTFKVVIQ